jgi:ubiquinol-cytochrome c reductase cytochrome c subunit
VDRHVLDDLPSPVVAVAGSLRGSRIATLAIVAGVFLLIGAGSIALAELDEPGDSIQSSAAQTSREEVGRVLFEERCAGCHGSGGEGTAQGPPIVGLGPAVYDFQLSTGRMPLADPEMQPVRKPPAFGPEEIDALVSFLTSLGPGGIPIPRVDPEAGDLSDGQRLYQLNCAACHGVSGNGGAVGDQVAPGLHAATATQVAEAVRIGPGTMPVFGPETVPDEDLASLARYVRYLEDPNDEGGAGLGHAGPTIEGFVALLVGLGTIVAITRWIGERS